MASQNNTQGASRVPKKRLIVCCDGSWQSSNHGLQSTPSNIAKIARSISNYTTEDDGSIVHQVVWYDAGVATGTDTVKSRIAGFLSFHEGTWGEGLDENVNEAYNFIVNNYNDGDELYFFGFSRGAYTARAAAGLTARVGIASNAMMDDFYKMYTAYKAKAATDPIENTKWGKTEEGKLWLSQCKKNFKIKCVGVFDTVGSVGWPDNVHFDVTEANKPYAFHNTDVHDSIENAFHALALDEHRAAFPPNMWSLSESAKTNLVQCWFPGFHLNSGGGNRDFQKIAEERSGDFESMANITFSWMVDRVQESTPLGFDEKAIYTIVERYAKNIEDLVKAQNTAHGFQHTSVYRGWGTAPSVDSLKGFQTLAGSKVRTPGEYNKDSHRTTHEYIHPVVAFAEQYAYKPPALDGFKREKSKTGNGYVWAKTYTPPSDEGVISRFWSYLNGRSVPAKAQVHIEIPEFVIPVEEGNPKHRKCEFGYSMERHLIRADTRRLWDDDATESEQKTKTIQETLGFFEDLDAVNGLHEYHGKECDPYYFFNYQGDNELKFEAVSSGFQ